MNKEKEIEELALSIIEATSPLGVKDLTKQFDYKTVAEYLVNAGYGNVQQAVREFAEELRKALEEYRLENEYFDGEEPNSNLWQMNSSIFYIEVIDGGGLIDQLIKERFCKEV